MNNEPVAWMWYQSKENTNPYTQMTGYSYLCFSEFKPDENVKVDEGTLIPLYTHPAELTDEEIIEICIEGGMYDCINDPYFKPNGNYSLDLDLIRFARAILRKAQEK